VFVQTRNVSVVQRGGCTKRNHTEYRVRHVEQREIDYKWDARALVVVRRITEDVDTQIFDGRLLRNISERSGTRPFCKTSADERVARRFIFKIFFNSDV